MLVAGFDCSADLFEQQCETMAGPVIRLFIPYVVLYERLKFGKYAAYSALDGFAESDAGIMVIHSKDDTMVLPENGYEKFYDTYGDDSRFCFIEYEDRGHDSVYYSDGRVVIRNSQTGITELMWKNAAVNTMRNVRRNLWKNISIKANTMSLILS